MMWNARYFGWFIALVLGAAGCSQESVAIIPADRLNQIVVSTPLLAEWTRPVARACGLNVLCLLDADDDPQHSMPDRSRLRQAQQSQLILVHGAGWEGWLKQVALPANRVVRTAAPGEQGWLQRAARTHAHGVAGSHTHAAQHPRTWLDPRAVQLQLETIVAAIRETFELDADAELRLEQAHSALRDQLLGYISALREWQQFMEDQVLIAQSEEFAYFARAIDRTIPIVPMDESTQWSSALRNQLRAAMPASRGGYVLFQAEPNAELQQRLQEELGLEVCVLPTDTSANFDHGWLTAITAALSTVKF